MSKLSIQGEGLTREEELDSLIQAELLIALAGKKSKEKWNGRFQRDHCGHPFVIHPYILVYEHGEYAYHLHNGMSETKLKANELEKIEAWLNSQ